MHCQLSSVTAKATNVYFHEFIPIGSLYVVYNLRDQFLFIIFLLVIIHGIYIYILIQKKYYIWNLVLSTVGPIIQEAAQCS